MRDQRKRRARSIRRAASLEDLPRRLRGALRLVAAIAENEDERQELAMLVRELPPIFRDAEQSDERAAAIARIEVLAGRILGAQ